ncbi:MAG TPA: outer membrane protein transport protein [Myxococcota bacterium]|nr:outer membrane protein transport protein [Myxococcota bacterium]HRY91841.1 outer membrane protein transport protein [Myxococcota bacterium]HSA20572.1 outer membrane protein transport protein [Myxococcota bacterium]
MEGEHKARWPFAPGAGRGPLTGLLAGLLVLAAAPAVRAGGFTIIEFGGAKTGMMTSIAKPYDLSGVYHNPAGIADLHGTRLHLSAGLSFVDAELRLRPWEAGPGYGASEDFIDTPVGADGYFEGTIKPTKYFGVMPMLAASSDFGLENGPVVALAAYVPDFIGAFLPEDAPTRYMVTEAYFVAGMAALTVGYRLPAPVDRVALGVSAGVMYVRIQGARWLNQPLLAGLSADYVLRLQGEDVIPFYNVGATVRATDQLTLGLAFIGGSEVRLDGSLEIGLPPGVTEEDPIIRALGGLAGEYDQTTVMQVPPGLCAGLHYQHSEYLAVALDFRYWFYRVFDKQEMYHDIDLEILGQPAVANPLITPKDYGDSWTFSLGFQVTPLPDRVPLDLMAGFTYDESPAPNRTKSLDSPTVDLWGFSFGLRYDFNETWRGVLTYYHYFYLRDETTDSVLTPPQNVDFGGSVDTVSLQLEVRL